MALLKDRTIVLDPRPRRRRGAVRVDPHGRLAGEILRLRRADCGERGDRP